MHDGLSLSRGVSLLCALPQFLLPTVTCSHCLPVVGRSIEAFKLHCLQVYDRARKRETVCAFTFVSLRSSTLNTQSRPWQLFLLLFPFSTCLPMHTHIHTHNMCAYVLSWALATLHAVILYGLFASLALNSFRYLTLCDQRTCYLIKLMNVLQNDRLINMPQPHTHTQAEYE